MSGVDTMAFDENDPSLMAELAELGWGDDSSGGGNVTATRAGPPAGHRPPPAAAAPARGRGGLAASAPPRREQSGNELLRSLGLSLNSLGDPEVSARMKVRTGVGGGGRCWRSSSSRRRRRRRRRRRTLAVRACFLRLARFERPLDR